MFCPNCGKEIGEGSRFCQYCGKKTKNEGEYFSNFDFHIKDKWLNGYKMDIKVPKEQIVFSFWILNKNITKIDIGNYEHVGIRKVKESDFVMKTKIKHKKYEDAMNNIYTLYDYIIKEPTQILRTDYNLMGIDYNAHYIYDLSGDNVPEIIFLGKERIPSGACITPVQHIVILGENNFVSLPGNQIVFSDVANVFYIPRSFQEDTTWKKYEMETDTDGNLVANCIASFTTDTLEEVEKAGLPKARLYNAMVQQASQSEFQRSVQCLNDSFVFEKY